MNRNEFYDSLSENVKARLKACKSEEEMLKMLDEEKIELDPDILDGVSGGVPTLIHGCGASSC